MDDTNTKLKKIVLDKLAWGWDADEMHQNDPHVSLAQIHAAFTHDYGHQDAMDEEIQRDEEELEVAAVAGRPERFANSIVRLPRL